MERENIKGKQNMSTEKTPEYDKLMDRARMYSQEGLFGLAKEIMKKMIERNPERLLGTGRVIEVDERDSQASEDIIH